jgi:hypothetical protein
MILTFACLLCEKLLEPLVFSSWLVKVAFFAGQNSNAKIAFIFGTEGVRGCDCHYRRATGEDGD